MKPFKNVQFGKKKQDSALASLSKKIVAKEEFLRFKHLLDTELKQQHTVRGTLHQMGETQQVHNAVIEDINGTIEHLKMRNMALQQSVEKLILLKEMEEFRQMKELKDENALDFWGIFKEQLGTKTIKFTHGAAHVVKILTTKIVSKVSFMVKRKARL
uniref:Uncharacterized protein n=1 Tax=Trieres chinensis TaxID=1514140 RepID=A0A7S1ZFZ5_TRICV|mmetsp:Transcript_24647/g.49939  ORF Transcript_24647/g.49939 Transcript_24647/m.49939 type:complete len:158 (+) Transcript_24647:205-678(+)